MISKVLTYSKHNGAYFRNILFHIYCTIGISAFLLQQPHKYHSLISSSSVFFVLAVLSFPDHWLIWGDLCSICIWMFHVSSTWLCCCIMNLAMPWLGFWEISLKMTSWNNSSLPSVLVFLDVNAKYLIALLCQRPDYFLSQKWPLLITMAQLKGLRW